VNGIVLLAEERYRGGRKWQAICGQCSWSSWRITQPLADEALRLHQLLMHRGQPGAVWVTGYRQRQWAAECQVTDCSWTALGLLHRSDALALLDHHGRTYHALPTPELPRTALTDSPSLPPQGRPAALAVGPRPPSRRRRSWA
jgi:hypothetical protein